MLIKLGKVKQVSGDKIDDGIENKKIEIEVTTDEYIFNKTGLFSSKEIIRIKKKDVTSITNENLHDIVKKQAKDSGLNTGKMEGSSYIYVNCNYLTFKKKSVDSVKLYFDNKSSSDLDGIITQLK